MKQIACLMAAAMLALATACQAKEPVIGEPGVEMEVTEPSESATEPTEKLVPESSSQVEATEPIPDWEFDAPENHGVDPAVLADLHEVVRDTSIHSIVTVKDGVIIDEYYKAGYSETSVFRLASCSKSFTGALIGIAIDEGLISGVDAKLADYLPQMATQSDPAKQDITIGHLLTHSSGLEWYEWNGGTTFQEFTGSENWVNFVLGRKLMTEPGSTFAYTTGGTHLLAAALQQATGKTAYEYGREHMFEPMGMDSVRWRADPQGVTDGGNGISMTARDAAKFGQLYLQGGRWGERQILPESWVAESVAVQFERSGNSGSYGYQWWLRPFGGYDTYYAMGHAGQFIFVVPELQLVTVMTSRFPQNTYAPWPYFENYVLAACSPEQGAAE